MELAANGRLPSRRGLGFWVSVWFRVLFQGVYGVKRDKVRDMAKSRETCAIRVSGFEVVHSGLGGFALEL